MKYLVLATWTKRPLAELLLRDVSDELAPNFTLVLWGKCIFIGIEVD